MPGRATETRPPNGTGATTAHRHGRAAWSLRHAVDSLTGAGPRQSRLALHDRLQGSAGPAGVVAQGGGDVGGTG
jgi:hypothetical protein